MNDNEGEHMKHSAPGSTWKLLDTPLEELSGRELGRIFLSVIAGQTQADPEIKLPYLDTSRFLSSIDSLMEHSKDEYNMFVETISPREWIRYQRAVAYSELMQLQLCLHGLIHDCESALKYEEIVYYAKTIRDTKIPKLIRSDSIYSFSCDPNKRNIALQNREAVIRSYRSIISYNKAVSLIAESYEVPELLWLSIEIKAIDPVFSKFYDLFISLSTRLKSSPTDTKDIQMEKFRTCCELFLPIDYATIKVPPCKVKSARELLAPGGVFTDPDKLNRFQRLMCTSKPRKKKTPEKGGT